MDLALRPTVIAGELLADDYAVIFEGRTIGRIRKSDERTILSGPSRCPCPNSPMPTQHGARSRAGQAAFSRRLGALLLHPREKDDIELWHRTQEAAARRPD